MRVLTAVASALFATAILAQGTPKQDPGDAPATPRRSRLEQFVDAAIADLDDERQHADALRRLENLGKLALPIVRQRLLWPTRHDLTREQQRHLLYVLGRGGREAAAAVDELRSWMSEGNAAVLPALFATLTELAPFLSREQADAVNRDARAALIGQRIDNAPLLFMQLSLGSAPADDALIAWLQAGGPFPIRSACRWLLAHGSDALTDDEQVIEAVRQQLEHAVAPFENHSYCKPRQSAPILAETWLALTGGTLDAATARALLGHSQPTYRRQAIAWLAEHGHRLEPVLRLDLMAQLWDSEPDLIVATAAALAGHGDAARAALPRLCQLHGCDDERLREVAGRAITAIARPTAAESPDEAAWLELAVRALHDEDAGPLPARGRTPRTRATLAEIGKLAAWHDLPAMRRLLALYEAVEPDLELATTVFDWIADSAPDVTCHALSWLARHPRVAADAIGRRRQGLLADTLVMLSQFEPGGACRPAAIEAGAWIATAIADDTELRRQLNSADTRLVARAIAELLRRPADQSAAAASRLHQLTTLQDDSTLQQHLTHFQNGFDTPYHLAQPVRVLAALALAHAGLQALDGDTLADDVGQFVHRPLDALPSFVHAAHEDGSLKAIIDRLEAQCRKRLFVASDLTWPTWQPPQ